MNTIPTKTDIIECHKKISSFINRTPVLTSSSLNEIFGCELFFKCENFQKVGAFKYRGATNAVLSLSNEELAKGIATHSSGNHAQAIALSAKTNNAKAYIVMPENAPEIKKNAVIDYGAEVTFCEPTQEAREKTLAKIVEETGATFIHPYNDYRIICGQATCAKELIEDTDDLDFIIAPVSGGGLLSGTSLSAHYFGENTKVIAAEPKGADDAFRSFRDNKIYPSINPQTIADGLRTSLCPKTFEIVKKHVSKILTVEEETIVEAMRLIWERMKIIVEPSGAVPLASIIENKEKFIGKKVGVINSGGNVDLDKVPFSVCKLKQ